jgi:hypothetical protein
MTDLLTDLTKLKTAVESVLDEIRYVEAQLTRDRATLALALTKANSQATTPAEETPLDGE